MPTVFLSQVVILTRTLLSSDSKILLGVLSKDVSVDHLLLLSLSHQSLPWLCFAFLRWKLFFLAVISETFSGG